jgi:nitrate/nitrite transport system substrate-binding protein
VGQRLISRFLGEAGQSGVARSIAPKYPLCPINWHACCIVCCHRRERELYRMEASRNGKCGCGLHDTEGAHDEAVEARLTSAVENAIVRAVLPEAASRRAFLAVFGIGTALAAISEVLPVAKAAELAQSTPGVMEKKQLKIGFIPITCATPIIMADPLGFYRKYGLEAEVIKTAGWAVIRDKSLNKEYDAAHMLSPMPLAITLGAGAAPQPWTMAGHRSDRHRSPARWPRRR